MTSGNRPAPEQGSWQIPGAASTYAPPSEPARGAGRGRPGVVALLVVLVELVIIAAACNQSVTKHAERYALDHRNFLGRAVSTTLSFAWRLTPLHGDNRNGFHIYASQFVTIGVFVVVSALLVLVVARGPAGFGRVFFGVWTAVIAASCVGCAVGALVTKQRRPDVDRATFAVFDAVNGDTVFAGAVIGLVAALVAAFVARATGRTEDQPAAAAAASEPAHVPEAPPPFYGSTTPYPPQREHQPQYQPQPQQELQYRPQEDQSQPAGSDETDGRTQQIPRFDPRGGQQWTPPAQDGESTQALPRAPDDDRR